MKPLSYFWRWRAAKPPSAPSRNPEIRRLRLLQKDNEKARANLILEVRTIEAQIKAIQADMQHEQSTTTRQIHEGRLLGKMAELEAARVKAARITEAIDPIVLQMQRREELELTAGAADARTLDKLILEYQEMIATRRETGAAIHELREADKISPSQPRTQAASIVSPLEVPPLMSEDTRRRLTELGLLAEE